MLQQELRTRGSYVVSLDNSAPNDLNGRIDGMEKELHGRIDNTEQAMREQRMALKVLP